MFASFGCPGWLKIRNVCPSQWYQTGEVWGCPAGVTVVSQNDEPLPEQIVDLRFHGIVQVERVHGDEPSGGGVHHAGRRSDWWTLGWLTA